MIRAKRVLRDLVILFFYLIGLSALRRLILQKKYGPLTRIICFHRVWDNERERFRKRMSWIKKNYNIIHLYDFFQGNLSTEKINVAITFDDGFKNWITNAVPILKELNIPATFFINSSFVGLSDKESLEFCKNVLKLKPENGLSWEDIRLMNKDNFELGGHTKNHVNLGHTKNCIYMDEEIKEDKKKIEKQINQEIKYFAYPFGSISDISSNAVKIIKDVGYQSSFTIIPGFNIKSTNRYMLYRDSLDVSLSKFVFKAWLNGSYDIFKNMMNRVKINTELIRKKSTDNYFYKTDPWN